jgi:hypothetical protein
MEKLFGAGRLWHWVLWDATQIISTWSIVRRPNRGAHYLAM